MKFSCDILWITTLCDVRPGVVYHRRVAHLDVFLFRTSDTVYRGRGTLRIRPRRAPRLLLCQCPSPGTSTSPLPVRAGEHHRPRLLFRSASQEKPSPPPLVLTWLLQPRIQNLRKNVLHLVETMCPYAKYLVVCGLYPREFTS